MVDPSQMASGVPPSFAPANMAAQNQPDPLALMQLMALAKRKAGNRGASKSKTKGKK